MSHGESDMAAISLPVISNFDAVVLAPLILYSCQKGPWLVRVDDCSRYGWIVSALTEYFQKTPDSHL